MAGGGPGDVLVCVVVMIDVGNVVAASLWDIWRSLVSLACADFGFDEAGKEGRGVQRTSQILQFGHNYNTVCPRIVMALDTFVFWVTEILCLPNRIKWWMFKTLFSFLFIT